MMPAGRLRPTSGNFRAVSLACAGCAWQQLQREIKAKSWRISIMSHIVPFYCSSRGGPICSAAETGPRASDPACSCPARSLPNNTQDDSLFRLWHTRHERASTPCAACVVVLLSDKAHKTRLCARVFVVYVRDPTFPLLCAVLALLIWSSVLLLGNNPFASQSRFPLSQNPSCRALHHRCGSCHSGESCIWNSSETTGRLGK